MPFEGSAAIDAMLGPDCPPVDAVGTVRPVDGDKDGQADRDIGAIELVPVFTPQLDGVRNASVAIESGDPDGTRNIDLTGTSGVLFADEFESN